MSDKSDPGVIRELQRNVWNRTASGYADAFQGSLTRVQVTQTFDPMLDAAHVETGTRLLDVATGPGILAAAAAERGATPVGTDIADEMIEEAKRRFPGIAKHLLHPFAEALAHLVARVSCGPSIDRSGSSCSVPGRRRRGAALPRRIVRRSHHQHGVVPHGRARACPARMPAGSTSGWLARALALGRGAARSRPLRLCRRAVRPRGRPRGAGGSTLQTTRYSEAT